MGLEAFPTSLSLRSLIFSEHHRGHTLRTGTGVPEAPIAGVRREKSGGGKV